MQGFSRASRPFLDWLARSFLGVPVTRFARSLTALILAAIFLIAAVPVLAQVEGGGSGSGSGVRHRGTYAPATSYRAGDMVTYQSATYLCDQRCLPGVLPTDATKWTKLGILIGASKFLDVSFGDVTSADPVRGDLIAAQGATPTWTRLAKGAAGTVLMMGADDPGWAAVPLPTKLLDPALSDVVTGDPSEGDLITGQGAVPVWKKLAKGAAGTVLTMGATEPAWTTPGQFETILEAQTVAPPTNLMAVCDPGGVSGTTFDRYFQLASSGAAGGYSLPSAEASVVACPDDSTITLTWIPAAGAAGVTVYWDTATGPKSHGYPGILENPSLATITFTVLTGGASPNLADDSLPTALPVANDARGFLYDFGYGWAFASTLWVTDLWTVNDLWLGGGTTRLRTGNGVPSISCGMGDTFYRADGASNSTIYACTAGNTWTPVLNEAVLPVFYTYRKAAYCYGNGTCAQTTEWDWNGLDSGMPTFSAGAGGATLAKASADFPDANVRHMQTDFHLPADWDSGTVTLDLYWSANVADAGKAAVWQAATVCGGAGDAFNTARNAYDAVTSAASASANVLRVGTVNLTMTGCSPGDILTVDIKRDPAHANDDLAATAQLVGVRLGYSR